MAKIDKIDTSDMSIKEISKITGTKIDAIKKQLSRGREKIKEVMSI